MIAVRLIPFAEDRPRIFSTLLCDGVSIIGVSSFAELLQAVDALQATHPNQRILSSLDNLGQAAYTSGHGIDKSRLDLTDGHDLTGLDPACFEDGEHLGYLSTPSEFRIRHANMLGASRPYDAARLARGLPWSGGNDGCDVVAANRDPDTALQLTLDPFAIAQIVPVARAADTLAAFPNGYFVGDLQPGENHGLAVYLEATYGMKLFGVGANFIGFRSEEPLCAEQARALAADIVGLFDEAPVEALQDLAALLTRRDWLLLRYTEN